MNGYLRLQQELSEKDIREVCVYLDTLFKAMAWIACHTKLDPVIEADCLETFFIADSPIDSKGEFVYYDIDDPDRIMGLYKRRKKEGDDGS